jgi:hypothetical protein
MEVVIKRLFESPELTGITKQLIVRPGSSLFHKNQEIISTNFYNTKNTTISAKFLIRNLDFQFYNQNTLQFIEGKAAEIEKNQFLESILGIRSNSNELFNTMSYLINIPSMLVEVQEIDDQKVNSINYKGSKISEEFKDSQINHNQWYVFSKR